MLCVVGEEYTSQSVCDAKSCDGCTGPTSADAGYTYLYGVDCAADEYSAVVSTEVYANDGVQMHVSAYPGEDSSEEFEECSLAGNLACYFKSTKSCGKIGFNTTIAVTCPTTASSYSYSFLFSSECIKYDASDVEPTTPKPFTPKPFTPEPKSEDSDSGISLKPFTPR